LKNVFIFFLLFKTFLFAKGSEADCNLMFELSFTILLILLFGLYREVSQKRYKAKMDDLIYQIQEKNALLKRLSVTDKLTGLNNRIKIDEVLNYNLSMFERYENLFSVIILDIDHFKKINDNYGHQVGDEVLKAFAKILKENVRITDTVGRWGGEEFMIIASETDSAEAVKFATNLKKKIINFDFPKVGRVTASMGVAGVDIGDSIEDVVSKADIALYSAKESGRNKVVCSL